MCGIIGYTGSCHAAKILLNGLQTLEYRGYDSAGIALYSKDTLAVQTIKTIGKVSCLKEKVNQKNIPLQSTCGIGHTRWATHGGVSETNSHPHTAGKVTLIHNGIIENYKELRQKLISMGITPISQTDTEIAALLINHYYVNNAEQAIRKAVQQMTGSYAFCILFSDIPDKIFAIRNGSPLVATHTDKGSLIASDVVALVGYSTNYFVLEENQLAILTSDDIFIKDSQGSSLIPSIHHISWDVATAKKGGYDYFMMKEIREQPEALTNTIHPRVIHGLPSFSTDNIEDSIFQTVKRIIITACGTAMHAGLIGGILIERLCRIPVKVEIASEFRYQNPILEKDTLFLAISQSGETADTLAALRLAKKHGLKTLSIVNVKGSTLARESDYVLYTHAGPEIAVASTKAYSVQVSMMYLIAFHIAHLTGKLTQTEVKEKISHLFNLSEKVEEALTYDTQMESIARHVADCNNIFFIGRGLDYALSREASLKLKEISYIHSEAYAAGELKHGTISLITDNVPVIALATQPDVYSKMISNIQEVRSRGAMVILITCRGFSVDAALCDHLIVLPEIHSLFTPFVSVVLMQYLAYYTAMEKGVNVDQPRNLAKSVTVE